MLETMTIVAMIFSAASGVLLSTSARQGKFAFLAAVAALLGGLTLGWAYFQPNTWLPLAMSVVAVTTMILASGWVYRTSPLLAEHGYWGRVGILLTNPAPVVALDRQPDQAAAEIRNG